MDNQQYCYEKVATPGSAFYLSLRPLPQRQRDLVVAVTAFYCEIDEVLSECQDIQLAQTKLNWWRGEVMQMAASQATHPVTIALQQFAIKPELLLLLIDAVEEKIAFTPFHTVENWINAALQRELLLVDLLSLSTDLNQGIVAQITLIIELTYYIQHLRDFVCRDIIYFPVRELQQFDVPKESLRNLKTTDQLRQLLQYQLDKVESAYQTILPILKKSKYKQAKHFLIRCKIAIKTLSEIQQSRFNVLENLIKLTPLREWWVSLV